MAAFLMLDATDPKGEFHHSFVVNVESISRIDPIGPKHCRFLMRENPSEPIYVAGTLEDLFGRIIEHSLPPMRAPGR